MTTDPLRPELTPPPMDGEAAWTRRDGEWDLLYHRPPATPAAPRAASPFQRRPGALNVGFMGEAYSRCGGTETFHETLIPLLQAEGIHIVGYSISAEPTRDAKHLAGIPLAHGPAAHLALAANSDVLVVWGIPDLAQFLAPDPASRPRVVSTIHGDGALPYFRHVMAAHATLADAIVAVQPEGLHCIPTAATPRRSVIENAVDPRKTRPTRPRDETRASLGIGPTDRLILWPHRYSSEKRGPLAIEIASMLPQRWRLAMIGEGHDRERLETLASEHGARVAITGARDDMGDLYHAADVALSTSESEGFGLAIAEALASGTPVVGTRTGILATAPHLASVLEIADPAARFAAAILEVIASPETTRRRAAAARDYVAKRWSIERFGRQWADATRAVANPPRPQAPPPPNPAAAFLAALACDYRVPRDPQDEVGCGCSEKRRASCLLGLATHSDGYVSLADCVACLKGTCPTANPNR